MTMSLSTPIYSSSTPTLDASDSGTLVDLIAQWQAKMPRNVVRRRAYDAKSIIRDLGISIPPQLRNLDAVLGWPAKTVDALADRIRFEGFVAPDEESDPFGLDEIASDNSFEVEFDQAVTSALIHSCSFLTVTQGDVESGEPDVLWMARSADSATGLWDPRRRMLRAGLSITDTDADNAPIEWVLYLRDKTVKLRKTGNRVVATVMPNPTGRVLMEPFVFKPELGRPFGHSRISRPVLSLTAGGIRTLMRSEVGAEFFTAPQRYALGVDEDALPADKWQAIMGRILAISRDAEGEIPTLGQFPQHSMQPHTDHLRMWASLLAGESSIPIDELGFPSDNPSSDPAIQSQRDPLRLIAEAANRSFGSALQRLAMTSLMLKHDEADWLPEWKGVRARFAPSFRMSDSAAADAVLKQVQTMPWLAESPVILEKLGYDPVTITRLLSDKRRAAGPSVLDRVRQSTMAEPAASPVEDAQAMKAKFEALGIAVRAGVDPDDAAARLGLEGIKLTGAMPTSFRLPESDASGLEDK